MSIIVMQGNDMNDQSTQEELISIEFNRFIDGEVWRYTVSARLSDLLNSSIMNANSKIAYERLMSGPDIVPAIVVNVKNAHGLQ